MTDPLKTERDAVLQRYMRVVLWLEKGHKGYEETVVAEGSFSSLLDALIDKAKALGAEPLVAALEDRQALFVAIIDQLGDAFDLQDWQRVIDLRQWASRNMLAELRRDREGIPQPHTVRASIMEWVATYGLVTAVEHHKDNETEATP